MLVGASGLGGDCERSARSGCALRATGAAAGVAWGDPLESRATATAGRARGAAVARQSAGGTRADHRRGVGRCRSGVRRQPAAEARLRTSPRARARPAGPHSVPGADVDQRPIPADRGTRRAGPGGIRPGAAPGAAAHAGGDLRGAAEALHAAEHGPPVAQGSRGLHARQVRDEHVHDRHGGGVPGRRRRLQRPLAAHHHRHCRGPEPARRRGGDGALAQARAGRRRRARDRHPPEPRVHRQPLPGRGRPGRGGITDMAAYTYGAEADEPIPDLFVD